jgi:hypothetical protein
MSSRPNDLEVAFALQEQYRYEFLQRQSEKQLQNAERNHAPTAPGEEEVVLVDDEAYARRIQRQMDREMASSSSPPVFFHPSTNFQNIGFEAPPTTESSNRRSKNNCNTDEEDARIAQELQDEELARQFSQRQISGGYYNNNNNTRNNSSERLSQELTDAEIARRLADQDVAYRQAQDQQRYQNQNNRPRFCRRIIPLTILVVAITIPLLFVFGVFTKDGVPFLEGFGNDWIESDPWNDVGSVDVDDQGNANITVGSNAVRWESRGQGLFLEVLNAMEDKYDRLLATAVENWDAGAPIDSLTLEIEKVAYDFECRDKTGVLKMCNGDYGDTRWRGLNEVKLNSLTKIIVSSTARINDYYLNSESDEQKLYTLCHEIGHGFGLPHWDTDFYNKDLGNCMDYTIRPEENMKPSASNFEYLAELYGGADAVSSSAAKTDPSKLGESLEEEEEEKSKGKNKKNNGRKLHVLHKSIKDEVHLIQFPDQDIEILRHYRLN